MKSRPTKKRVEIDIALFALYPELVEGGLISVRQNTLLPRVQFDCFCTGEIREIGVRIPAFNHIFSFLFIPRAPQNSKNAPPALPGAPGVKESTDRS